MKKIGKKSVSLHRKLRGKLSVEPKIIPKNREILSLIYTPGVAEPCREISRSPEKVYDYTMKGNTVAVVTDGSALLGLGNRGAEASLPVMEGKCVLFKSLANVDAFPIALKTQKPNEIIKVIENISPSFGAINIEDIASPNCFYITEKLENLGMPVFHDDQTGTAIVTAAALENASKVSKKKMNTLDVTIVGAGAAGLSIAKMLRPLVKSITLVDEHGVLFRGRKHLNIYQKRILKKTKPRVKGNLAHAIEGADVLIGVSAPGIVSKKMVRSMNERAIVFAMANPTPEISFENALEAGAFIVGTGRSDYPNQINNALVFPGIFRGALDAKAKKMTQKMYLAAAKALASSVKRPTRRKILPNPLGKKYVKKIALAVKKAA